MTFLYDYHDSSQSISEEDSSSTTRRNPPRSAKRNLVYGENDCETTTDSNEDNPSNGMLLCCVLAVCTKLKGAFIMQVKVYLNRFNKGSSTSSLDLKVHL